MRMKLHKWITLGIGIGIALALSACGSDNDFSRITTTSSMPLAQEPTAGSSSLNSASNSSSSSIPTPVSTSSNSSRSFVSGRLTSLEEQYKKINVINYEPKAFIRIEGEQLANLLKNGLRQKYRPQILYWDDYYSNGSSVASSSTSFSFSSSPVFSSISNSSAGGAEAPSISDQSFEGFSETTILEVGVDESDISKYDGKYWYVLNNNNQNKGINILSTNAESGSLNVAGEFKFSRQSPSANSMYIRLKDGTTDELIVLRHGTDSNSSTSSTQHQLQWLKVNEDSITEAGSLNYPGELIDSRKIGNRLYLVSKLKPTLQGLQYATVRYGFNDNDARQNEDIALQNENIIANANLDQLLNNFPEIKNCLVTPNINEDTGVHELLMVTTIDLDSQSTLASECIAARSEGIYMSPTGMYIGASQSYNYQPEFDFPFFSGRQKVTTLHKLALNDQLLKYSATGNVMGGLGWSIPATRMSEKDGKLRVITSSNINGNIEHQLHILNENTTNKTLEIISTLPNAQRPNKIGKPGEDIYATRFVGDRAYIVTYRTTDPLYTIDLSDPADPKITGELEIPGFSSFMQPLGDKLLFTIGQTDDRNTKVELFDVGDINAPKSVQAFSFVAETGNTSSQSEQQYKALSFLVNGDKARATLPLSFSKYDRNTRQYSIQNSLELFNISGIQEGEASITHQGSLTAKVKNATRNNLWGSYQRSIIHNDSVFFLSTHISKTDQVEALSASWFTPETLISTVTIPASDIEIINK